MVKFFLFIKKIHFVLLFVIIEALAIHYYAGSTVYSRARLVAVSNALLGGAFSGVSTLGSYFSLRGDNENLNKEIARLKGQLDRCRPVSSDSIVVAGVLPKYIYTPAQVVGNSISRVNNYITLNKGRKHGMEPDMAVVSASGILGYVLDCSDKFSICISILNRDFRTSGRIKGTDFYGSVYWDGFSSEHVMLSEISRYAKVDIGDTVLTTNYSSIFPPDLMIGTVDRVELVNNDTYYDVRVKLMNNMSSLYNVMVIKYTDGNEQRDLEERYVRE